MTDQEFRQMYFNHFDAPRTMLFTQYERYVMRKYGSDSAWSAKLRLKFEVLKFGQSIYKTMLKNI